MGDTQARLARIKALARKMRVTHQPLWPGREALYSNTDAAAGSDQATR